MTDFFLRENKKISGIKSVDAAGRGAQSSFDRRDCDILIAWQGSDKVVSKTIYKQSQNIESGYRRDAKAAEYNIKAEAQLDAAATTAVATRRANQAASALAFSVSVASALSQKFESNRKLTCLKYSREV